MILLWATPFALQGLLIIVDELHFHRRRGLPLWERIGHPLDSLVLGLALLIPVFAPLTGGWLLAYAIVSLFSCLFVTKDEHIHSQVCQGTESWLHAILFQLHPVVLISGALLWTARAGRPALQSLPSPSQAGLLIGLQALAIFGFMAYQFLYWRSRSSEGGSEIDNSFYGDLGERWYTAKDDPIALLRAESRLRNPWVVAELKKRLGEGRKRILDVGCGAGFLSNALAQAGHEVVGIDLSQESLDVAKGRDTTRSVRYLRMDANNIQLEPESFDAVCSMDFLEHVASRDRLIAEIQRVLKPGGLFFFHTFNQNPIAWLVVIKGVEWFVANTPKNMHVYDLLCPPEKLRRECSRNGLQVEALLGMKPRVLTSAFWKMIFTGTVEDEFSFEFTRSKLIAYSGLATKAQR